MQKIGYYLTQCWWCKECQYHWMTGGPFESYVRVIEWSDSLSRIVIQNLDLFNVMTFSCNLKAVALQSHWRSYENVTKLLADSTHLLWQCKDCNSYPNNVAKEVMELASDIRVGKFTITARARWYDEIQQHERQTKQTSKPPQPLNWPILINSWQWVLVTYRNSKYPYVIF